jgi:alpha-tubulin suppressor-like RCC1 family protein
MRKVSVVIAVAVMMSGIVACTADYHTGPPPPPPAQPPPPPPSPPGASKLAFSVEPSTTQASAALTPSVQVTIEDTSGARVSGATNAVTLALHSNPVGGILSGTVTRNAIDGIATFDSLTVDRPGSAFLLTASASGLAAATSVAFDVHVTFIAVTAGYAHSCGLAQSGAAFCWGSNSYYQLGTGTTSAGDATPFPAKALTPVPVSGGHRFVSMRAAPYNTCALTSSGAAYCWGSEVGGGDATSPTPSPVTGGLMFGEVRGGAFHACGLVTTGAAYCWGYNQWGQLGTGDTSSTATPLAVTGGHSFVFLSTGPLFNSCALTAAGTAYCWGENRYGQLGTGDTAHSTSPVAVSGGLTFVAVNTAGEHTCGVTDLGATYCWGEGLYGQLGTGDTIARFNPAPVSGGLTFTLLSGGGAFTCGLTGAGAAYCWGYNHWGQLGTGDTASTSVPVPVSGGLTFATLSAGNAHACAITIAGVTYCWGFNLDGWLGDGTVNISHVPTQVVQ